MTSLWLLRLGRALLRSPVTWVLLTLAVVWTLHVWDRNRAVNAAIANTVTRIELETSEAARKLAARNLILEAEAAALLQDALTQAEHDLAQAEAELDLRNYDTSSSAPASCRVDGALYERLRD